MRAAKGLRAVTVEEQTASTYVGDLVIILGVEENYFTLLDYALSTVDVLNAGLTLDHKKALRLGVVVHVGVVSGFKMTHPGAKLPRPKEPRETLLLVCFLREIHELHN